MYAPERLFPVQVEHRMQKWPKMTLMSPKGDIGDTFDGYKACAKRASEEFGTSGVRGPGGAGETRGASARQPLGF